MADSENTARGSTLKHSYRTELYNAVGLCLLFTATTILGAVILGTAMTWGLGIAMGALFAAGAGCYYAGSRERQRMEDDKLACEQQLKLFTKSQEKALQTEVTEKTVPAAEKEAGQATNSHFQGRLRQEKANAQTGLRY